MSPDLKEPQWFCCVQCPNDTTTMVIMSHQYHSVIDCCCVKYNPPPNHCSHSCASVYSAGGRDENPSICVYIQDTSDTHHHLPRLVWLLELGLILGRRNVEILIVIWISNSCNYEAIICGGVSRGKETSGALLFLTVSQICALKTSSNTSGPLSTNVSSGIFDLVRRQFAGSVLFCERVKHINGNVCRMCTPWPRFLEHRDGGEMNSHCHRLTALIFFCRMCLCEWGFMGNDSDPIFRDTETHKTPWCWFHE